MISAPKSTPSTRAAPAFQADAADHARGDGVEFHEVADGRRRAAAVGRLHEAGERHDRRP